VIVGSHSEFPMTVRSESRQEGRKDGGKISGVRSAGSDHRWIQENLTFFKVLGEAGLQNPETGTSTKVSDTRSWRSQESRLFITGVRSYCETPKSQNRHINKGFGYQELEESRVETLHHRSPEVAKCETPKS
jgi:hypothetical protein